MNPRREKRKNTEKQKGEKNNQKKKERKTERKKERNKDVYTTALSGAVMTWAGAVMIWAGACSNTNSPTLKMPKNAKKNQSVSHQRTDGWTDGRTDRPTR